MIKTIKEWKQYNESILVPRNLEGRKDKLRQDRIKLLSQEVIEGYLEIDESFEGIGYQSVKVKEIRGNVDLTINKGYIPTWLRNVKIIGYFYCSNNKLTSLDNCPYFVVGDFFCSNNKLTSLNECPKYTGGDFYCRKNLVKLELPKDVKIKGRFVNE